MARVDYQAHIRSPEWRAIRVAVILRAKGVCERCRKWPVVNVHHITYKNLGREAPEDLLGVCSKCHAELHGEQKPASL